jgi:hypothetical protein
MTDRTRRLGWFRALAATLGLAACEDVYTITRVEKLTGFARSHVAGLAAGGVPTEIHGTPFAGLTPDEIAGALTGPQNYPAGMRFRAVAPGSLPPGRAARLVLAFNRAGHPNGLADCRGGAIPTVAPREVGFSVTASFCSGERLQATGHMEVQSVRAGDREAFARVMRLLFRQILP